MELILLNLGSNELEYVWNYIENHPLNEGIEDPTRTSHNGHGWAYMGSYRQGNRVIHQCRHRCHQTTNNVVTLTFNASDDFDHNEIGKTFKL